MITPSYYDEPPNFVLVQSIEYYSDKIKIPENIYRLGAECCQAWIDNDRYPFW